MRKANVHRSTAKRGKPNGALAGRVALVTGAARGQGHAIAHRLARAGASVIAGDLLPEVEALAGELRGPAHAAHLDVTDASSWQRLIAQGLERFGRLDILVNNAGVLRRMELERETTDGFEGIWRVNCLGAFLGIQAARPHLRAAATVRS